MVLLALAASSALVWRWYHLQIERFSHFKLLSEENQVALQQVGPIRGRIFDRNGVLLADNDIRYQVRVNSDNAEYILNSLGDLQTFLPLEEKTAGKLEEAAATSVYTGDILLADYLTEPAVVRFIDVQQDYPEVVLDAKVVRTYPQGESAVHLIGHVGRINPDDVARLKNQGKWRSYIGSEFIGKRGIEVAYETRLHGKPGLREVNIDAHGRVLETLQRLAPTSGADVWLTIDYDLQRKAEQLLTGWEGAVVALNPYNGAVLALASAPRFNNNTFIGGFNQQQWDWLNSRENGTPLVHRAIYGQYAPGSAIKPFFALAALKHGWRDKDYTFHSTGVFHLTPRHKFHDWKAGGHGTVDLSKSIIRSVNSFYYQLAHDVGVDQLQVGLSEFGFGQMTRIDLGGERAGLVPTEKWKQQELGERWYPGDTIPLGVGQGYLEVTPLQLAKAMAIIANGGYDVTPHLVSKVGGIRLGPAAGSEALFQPEHLRIVRDALAKVTQPGGTAYSRVGKDSLYPIAGKTGTAQVAQLSYTQGRRVKNEELPKQLRDHAWFVGFAPAYNPRIVVATIVEHGGSGGVAAGPVVRALMDEYLLKLRGMRFNQTPELTASASDAGQTQ